MTARIAAWAGIEVHTEDVNERGAGEDASPAESAVTKPSRRLMNLALIISSLFGLGLGLILGITRPAGERLQGPLGLLFMILIATTGTLSFVTTVGAKRS